MVNKMRPIFLQPCHKVAAFKKNFAPSKRLPDRFGMRPTCVREKACQNDHYAEDQFGSPASFSLNDNPIFIFTASCGKIGQEGGPKTFSSAAESGRGKKE